MGKKENKRAREKCDTERERKGEGAPEKEEMCAVGDKPWTFQERGVNKRELNVFPAASLSGPVW